MSLFSCFSCSSNATFDTLAPHDFARLLADRPDLLLLDVRTPAEYAEGHLPGSRNIDVLGPDFERRAAEAARDKAAVALYCRSGRRSKQAAGILARRGVKVYELGRGWLGWLDARLPTAR